MPVHLIALIFIPKCLQFLTLVSDYTDLVKSLPSDVHHHQFATKQNIATSCRTIETNNIPAVLEMIRNNIFIMYS